MILLLALFLLLGAATAWGYWSADSGTNGNGAAAATSVDPGATPTANAVGSAVTLNWSSSTLATGQAVTGYQIKRYTAGTSTVQTILSACSGTVTATTCTESAVPAGSWQYTVTPVFATNWRGAESAKSATVVIDPTSPVNAISLSGAAGGSFKSGTTVFYRGTAAGSFTLTNALSDAGSGPASSQTAALGGTATGWSHTPSTVSTPSGGPYVSTPFTWTAGTGSAPTEVVTGRDVAGNTAATNLTFTNDSSTPAATISYPDGFQSGGSVPVTFTSSDSGSGVVTGQLERRAAPLSAGTCGTYGGFVNVGPANPTSVYADSTVTTGTCYVYRYVVTDRVGNQITATSTNVAKVDYFGAVTGTPGLLSHWRFGEKDISRDSFTGTDGTLLNSRVGEIGAAWTKWAADGSTASLTNEGRLRRSGTGGVTYVASGVPGAADYQVEVDLHVKSLLANDYAGVVGRADLTNTTGQGTRYLARYNPNPTAQWELIRWVGGTRTLVGTAAEQTLTAGQTYRLTLDMKGSTIRLLVDGTERITATDSAIVGPGSAGLRMGAGTTGAAATNTTGIHLDNFAVTPRAVDGKGSNTGDYRRGVQLGSAGAIAGDTNTAAVFDGANTYLQTPTTGFPVGAANRSVETWFRTSGPAAGQGRQALFTYGTNADTQEFGVWLENDGRSIKSWGGGATDRVLTWTNSFNDNTWHHFVSTYDGTSTRMYVDGVLGAGNTTATRNTVINSYGFGVGAVLDPSTGGVGTSSYFNGSLDEMSFYTTTLSPATVADHYQLGASPAPDFAGPTGGSVDATGLVGTGSRYSTSRDLSLALAKGTDPSGVSPTGATLSRATAPLTSTGGANGVCGTFDGYTLISGGTDAASPKADTVTDQACYRYQYVVSDTVGNPTTYTSGDIKVDSTAPAAPSLGFSAFTNTSATGSTLYYRSDAASGSFSVTATATDAASGIASYAFPAVLGTNWTMTGNESSRTYSWTSPPAAPGAISVTATNNATGGSPGAPITFESDITKPPAGTVSYLNGTTKATTVNVSFTTGTDAGSGNGTPLLQRASATLTGSTCGTFGTFATITNGAHPTSPLADPVTAGNCYKYQYVVPDKVGNQHIATSASVAKISQPYAATISAETSLVNWFRFAGSTTSSDSFTGTAGTLLSARAPELGTSWTRWVNDTSTAVLTDADRVRKSGNGSVGYYTAPVPATADYLVTADVVVKSTGTGHAVGVVGRWDISATTGMGTSYVAAYNGNSGNWELIRIVNGTNFFLGTFARPVTDGPTHTLGLDMNGSTIRLLVDGIPLISVVDAAITGAGRAGVRFGYTGDTATQGNAVGLHLDNFLVTPPVADSKTTANTGDYFNGVTLGAPGAIGGDASPAASFDGVNDYASVKRTIQDDFSIEFWFKSTQGLGTGVQWYNGAGLVDAEVNGAANDFGVSLRSDGRVVAGVGTPDVSIVSSTGGFNNGAWHHVVFTRIRSTGALQLYVDGAAAGSAIGSTATLTSSAVINFGRLASAGGYYAGSLDEVALYNTALSASAIAAHYAAQ